MKTINPRKYLYQASSLFLVGFILLLNSTKSLVSAQGANLIPNPSLESVTNSTPQDWSHNNWGQNVANFSITNPGQDGNNSVQVQVTSHSNGDAKWYFNPISIAPSTSYQFTDYYKSNVPSFIVIEYQDTNGGFSYQEIASLPIQNQWTQSVSTFTTPSNVSKLTIFHLLDRVGTLTIDNVSLTTTGSITPTPTTNTPTPTRTPTPTPTIPTITQTPTPTSTTQPTPTNTPQPSTPTPTPKSNADWQAKFWNFTGSSTPSIPTTTPNFQTQYSSINFNWGTSSPNSSITINRFVGQFTKTITTSAGLHQVQITADDGVKLFIDGQLTINAWVDQAAITFTQSVNLTAGNHQFEIQYYERAGQAVLKFNLQTPSGSTPTPTQTPTATPTNPTFTPTPTPTNVTPSSTPTSTPTLTPIVPTGTPTPAPTVTITDNVPNNSVEIPSSNPSIPVNWSNNKWGTNTATFSYLNTGYNSSRSVKTEVTAYTSGDAKWYYEPQPTNGKINFTFKDAYQSNVTTEIVAQMTNSSGINTYYQLGLAPASPNQWSQFTGTVTAPQGIQYITFFHLINSVGYLITDDYHVLTDNPIQVTDFVPNNSFEQVSGNNPAGWYQGKWGTNNPTFTYNNFGHTGTRSVKVEMASFTNGDAKWAYDPQPISPSTQYNFTDYYQSNTPTWVVMQYQDAQGNFTYFQLPQVPASPNGWAKYTANFTTPATATAVTALHVISSIGYLTVDDYQITIIPVPSTFTPMVSVTLDDGWLSAYTNAKPILDAHNFKATYNITTGLLSVPGYMNDQQVANLISNGYDIQSHTVNHPFLTSLNDADLEYELVQSKAYLESHFGITVNGIASPYGDVDQRVIDKIKTIYSYHRGVQSDYNYANTFDKYNILVQNLEVTTTTAEVQSWVNFAKNNHAWLVLVYHQVDDLGSQYSVSTSNFNAQMNAISQSGIQVVTIDQAMKLINLP